mmetsp:Transcript_40488/g.160645  ORF Transcript_40488/g.160645 Transcript_40488/m.160645 type:complete len:88 (+) Transcript_40488:720-983(+)
MAVDLFEDAERSNDRVGSPYPDCFSGFLSLLFERMKFICFERGLDGPLSRLEFGSELVLAFCHRSMAPKKGIHTRSLCTFEIEEPAG